MTILQEVITVESVARDYLDQHGGDIDLATNSLLSDLSHSGTLKRRIGQEVLRRGCEVSIRWVVSHQRIDQLRQMRVTDSDRSPSLDLPIKSLSASGKALREAFGGQDPYDWPVPFADKRLGDCTPEELMESVARINLLIDTYTWERDYIQAVADLGTTGKPIRKTVDRGLLLDIAKD